MNDQVPATTGGVLFTIGFGAVFTSTSTGELIWHVFDFMEDMPVTQVPAMRPQFEKNLDHWRTRHADSADDAAYFATFEMEARRVFEEIARLSSTEQALAERTPPTTWKSKWITCVEEAVLVGHKRKKWDEP